MYKESYHRVLGCAGTKLRTKFKLGTEERRDEKQMVVVYPDKITRLVGISEFLRIIEVRSSIGIPRL